MLRVEYRDVLITKCVPLIIINKSNVAEALKLIEETRIKDYHYCLSAKDVDIPEEFRYMRLLSDPPAIGAQPLITTASYTITMHNYIDDAKRLTFLYVNIIGDSLKYMDRQEVRGYLVLLVSCDCSEKKTLDALLAKFIDAELVIFVNGKVHYNRNREVVSKPTLSELVAIFTNRSISRVKKANSGYINLSEERNIR
jgi:hypothetical protein